MNNKIIITIGREYGSGGREIGEKLAERLEIPCYDKLLIDRIAKESNFSPDFIEKVSENHKEIMMNTVIDTYYGGMPLMYSEPSVATKVDVARVKAIKELSNNGSCIIIGRAADYILREEPNLINIFVCADMNSRVERIMERNSVNRREAKKMIKDIDKNRSSFYNFNTDKKWGMASSYDICVNSSLLGIDDTVEVILLYIYRYMKRRCISKQEIVKGGSA